MVTQTIKSQSPYYDDFDPAKDYVQVLFRPGYPVQARELTTLQTFLQEQVSRLSGDFYKTGDLVRNGEITFHNDVEELILSSSSNSQFPSSGISIIDATLGRIQDLEGKIIQNGDGTVKARVLPALTGSDATKYVGNIYIKYLSEGTFDSDGDYLYVTTEDNPDVVAELYQTYSSKNVATIASIADGLFFVNGLFTKVKEQYILISNTTQIPSCNIGLFVVEEVITQNEDSSLYDNARGTTNEGAPGAHRLKLSLTLGFKPLGEAASPNFYRVATYVDGVKQEANEINAEYANFISMLARRTHDESGDYSITPFNPTLDHGDSDQVFEITIAPAKAYVKGYEIEKNAPTKLYLERHSGTKVVKNNQTPFAGTTSVQVTGLTGVLPGSTSGTFYNPANRVQLRNAANEVIGVARPWAIADESRRGTSVTKMFLYDIRMFTIVKTDGTFATDVLTGYDVYTSRTRGTAYKDEGSAGIANAFAAIAATGRFRVGGVIQSDALGANANITGVTDYALSDVASITATNGFDATVAAGTVANENASLLLETSKHIKTLKDASTIIMDNDFNVISDTGAGATVIDPANGFYDSTRVDDQTEVTKTLRFAYLKVRNATGSNFGWSAAHKQVSLHYPDIYKVHKVNETSASTFATGQFKRLSINTAGVIPQGTVLTGALSGTKAIVALSNSANPYETALATTWHVTQTGTGSASTIEAIFTKGTSFTAGEQLIAEVPGSEVAYTYETIYTSETAATGTDITGNFMLDDGQRNEYYDLGRLIRKDNTPAPTNDIVIFFSYFEADPSTAHYYSVDSYSAEYFYDLDPRFFDKVRDIKPEVNNEGKRLRNSFDFRLRVQPITDTTLSPFNFAARSFYDQDRLVPNSKFTTDFEENLGRIDLVSLEKTGQIRIISGIPSSNPARPQKSEEGMALFYAQIDPVVLYPELDVTIDKLDNRRYTMRDIGDIESRLNRVEENMLLNVLEAQALTDDNDGRTKSGFVVPNLGNEKDAIMDVDHPEYNATIDVTDRAIIPAQTDGLPVEMTVSATANISTFFDGYYLKAFTEEAFSTQLDATQGNKINPFATWSFEGDIKLNPKEDNWRIRKDDYFTSLFGELKPFEGSAADFANFNKITTRSPGGRSTSTSQWIGAPINRRTQVGRQVTDTVLRAQTTTTTRSFDRPRSTGEVTTTKTGSQVIQNPQDYFMRSVTINYDVKNLKPDTTHNVFFGGKIVGTSTSNDKGQATGSFTVPAQTFRAGTQTVAIQDVETSVSSFGFSSFKSVGHIDSYSVISTTDTEVVTRSTSTAVVSRNTWTDPVAQMFMLPNVTANVKQTSIITSLDLWFALVDTRAMMGTVKVEIRETVNGYPGGPSSIIGETEYLTVPAGKQTTAITNASAFNCKFKEPVVLRGGVEYAIVVKTPSDIMEIYVAEMGASLIDGSGVHSSQPNVGGYFGSFFKSQNNSTWTAEQSKDMTYRLYRAKFDSADSTITMKNTITDSGAHKGDIGAFSQGLAMETFQDSKYVKVYHPNHGFHYNGAQVTISGVTPGATFNGLANTDLTGTFDVLYATLDTYMINANTNATNSGKINVGTFTAFATQDLVFDSMMTNLMATKEQGDEIGLSIQTTVTSPLNLVVANNKIANTSIKAPVKNGYESVEIDSIVDFDEPMVIRSATNSSTNDLDMVITLKNGSDYTSPIIKAGSNLSPIIYRNIVGGLLTDSDIEGLTTTAPNTADDDVTQEYVSRIQAVQAETEHSAWVTKQIDLEIPADGVTLKFDADMAPTSSVMAAYKVRAIGDTTPFDQLEWIDFPYAQQITEDNYGDFSSDAIEKGYTMYAPANFDFSSFKIRLRMNTEDESQIPMLKNLRVIADV